MPSHLTTSYKEWLDEQAHSTHIITRKESEKMAKDFTTATTEQTTTSTTEPQQGWAQPTGALQWHYFRFAGEPTGTEASWCGRWGTAGVDSEDLFDRNHGCSDHCAKCQKAR